MKERQEQLSGAVELAGGHMLRGSFGKGEEGRRDFEMGGGGGGGGGTPGAMRGEGCRCLTPRLQS